MSPSNDVTMKADDDRKGLAWQVSVWDRISQIYLREVDKRFAQVVEHVIKRAGLTAGEQVLDLGTGTGSVAIAAASLVGPGGRVLGLDVSHEMLVLAKRQATALGLVNCSFQKGRGEAIPVGDGTCDVVLASLSLMYVLDRSACAREVGRVLRTGGRLVAAVWAGPELCDILRFQQIAGRFAPTPPVSGVGPGALADPSEFVQQLKGSDFDSRVEAETLGFNFSDFAFAWDVLAGVTTAQLAPKRQQEAKEAVLAAMWPSGDGARYFRNITQFIIGQRK
jgi:SAM-dependent methyltransferase